MKKIVISRLVEIALSPLSPAEAGQVYAEFDCLRRWDEDEAVRNNAIPLDSVPGVYVLRTTTDLRVFFRIDDDTITILDVARLSTILTTAGIRPATVPSDLSPERQVR